MDLEKIKSEISIIDYARSIGLTPVKIGRYYTLKEHDSVRIDATRNLFTRNSTRESGSIIDFAMVFTGRSFGEVLNDFKKNYNYLDLENVSTGYKKPKMETKEAEEPKEVELPPADNNVKNVYAYLIKTRCIDSTIVDELVRKKMLYQDTHKNCVFVSPSRDNPKFAMKRGTNTANKFIGDCKGNDYAHSFFIDNNAGVSLIVTEGVIDALSIMTNLKDKGWEDSNIKSFDYLALTGVGKYEKALQYHLQRNLYSSIFLCLDNDEAGIKAAADIKEYISNNYGDKCTVTFNPPSRGKDYNDALCIRKGKNVQKKKELDEEL